jgi:sugar/nucleoside kinase (ribokinase family)
MTCDFIMESSIIGSRCATGEESMSRKFDCLIIGDVMLDVFVKNSGDAVRFLRGGTSYSDFAHLDFGGAGNVATGLSLLGGRASFIGKGGDDFWVKMYKQDLINNGVATNIFLEKGSSTGLALVALGKRGERSLCVFRGANDRLSIDEIDKSTSLLTMSKYLYFSGFSLVSDPQKAAVLHAVKLAKQYGAKVVFDPAAHNLIRSHFKLFDELLDTCDVFCPNLQEAKAITRTRSLQNVMDELTERARFTVIKCGKTGCIFVTPKSKIKIPAFSVNCLDSTGAGDAFVAALIYGLAKNLSLRAIGELANWFAAQVVTRVGSRSFPTRLEIANFRRDSAKDGARTISGQIKAN